MLSATPDIVEFTSPQTDNARTSNMLVRIGTLLVKDQQKAEFFRGRPSILRCVGSHEYGKVEMLERKS